MSATPSDLFRLMEEGLITELFRVDRNTWRCTTHLGPLTVPEWHEGRTPEGAALVDVYTKACADIQRINTIEAVKRRMKGRP